MANLLRWSAGMTLPKKKDENNGSLISSIQTMRPAPIKTTTTNNTASSVVSNTNSNFNSSFNDSFSRTQQINEQVRQQAEQRRQQEEQLRQQRIEKARQEQEERQRKENERRLQQQQALRQKQNNLLNSSLKGGSLLNNLSQNTDFNTFRNNLQANQQKTSSWAEREKQQAQQDANDNPWRKYYDEERQKVRDQAYKSDHFGSWLQDVFNSGWDRRLAETAARNRYASELNQKAFDDNGNVKDDSAANLAKQVNTANLKVANNYAEMERANSRALGASYDSDYKNNPFAAAANAIRRMDVGNAIFEGDDSGATGVGRFIFNLLPGMLNAPTTGFTNISEAISGKGLDSSTGKARELDAAERWGRGLSGAIDAAGVFYGGSGELLNNVASKVFRKGAEEATKQVVKQTTKNVIKGYIKSMLEEGAEEGVQQAFEFFGDGGKLVTKDGDFDTEAFKQLLTESGQAAVLGAAGGGLFHAGSRIVNAGLAKQLTKKADKAYASLVNNGAVDRLTNALENVQNGQKNTKNVTFARMSSEMLGDINTVREAQGKNPLSKRKVTAFSNAINEHLGKHIQEYGSARNVAQAAFDVLTGSDTLVLPGSKQSKNTLLARTNTNRFADSVAVGDTETGETSLKDISPRSSREIRRLAQQKTALEGNSGSPLMGASEGGVTQHGIVNSADSVTSLGDSRADSAADPSRVLNSIVPQNEQSVNLNNRLIGRTNLNENTNLVEQGGQNLNENVNKNANVDLSKVQTNQDGNMVKINANGRTTRLSDAELANVINQEISQETTNNASLGINPLGDNNTNFRPGSDDINTLAKRVAQGDTYAQQKLAELTNQNQNENSDWRGKSVDEVINPEADDIRQNPKDTRFKNAIDVSANAPTSTDIEVNGTPEVSFSERDAYIEAADRAEIEKYYKQYGEDFYEQMPDYFQDVYEQILDNQPRNADGVYVDPITGDEVIDTVIKGGAPDGRNLIKTDYNLPENATTQEVSRAIRKTIQERFQGNSYRVGDTDTNAAVTRRTRNEMMYQQSKMSDADFHKKGDLVGNLDELIENMTDIRKIPNYKQDQKPNIDHYISGRVPIDLGDGKIYNPRVDLEVGKNGKVVGYDIADIKELSVSPSDQSSVRRVPGRGSNIAQSDQKVQTRNDLSDSKKLIDIYYRKYGNGFYDAMPESLQIAYENMLDGQPRDRSGRYTDPITGETWIDSTAQEKSSFAENTSSNQNFSAETRTDLKNDPLTYKPTTNEERLARANEILSSKSSDDIDNYLRENFFNVKPKDADSADMVLAGEYAKMLDAKGQYARSTEIINRMSEIGTKQGQNIQALSLMMNRSPEGIANMAQTAIKKGGGEMTGELRQEIVKRTQEIGKTRGKRAELAAENNIISKQIMDGKGDLKALRKRQMAIAQEYRQSLDQEGRQFSQLSDIVGKNSPDNRSVFGSIWRAGLLSGPRTHTGNAVSNSFQNVLNAGADRFAAGLDWTRSKITGAERQVVASDKGLRTRGKGLKRGLSAAGEVLKTGNNLWESIDTVASGSNVWGQGGEMEFKNKIANTMVAKPTNFVFRAMSAGDLPFRYSAFENAVRTEAKRQGMNQGYKGQALQDYINSRVATPDPELQAYGIRKGNESVYDMDTKLSDLMARVDKFIDGQDNKLVKNGLKTAKTLITPFVKVPSKVLSTAVDYSPLGSVKAIVNKIGSTKNYTTGQFETDLARSGLGTAGFVGLGYALSAAGMLTGGYPDSQDERNRWKAEGIEPNSIKIGDKYVSLNYLGPASMLVAIGSGIQQRQEKGEDALTITSGTLMDTLNTFLDQSYVQGLNNAVQAISDSQRYGESYINSFTRSLVPNLLRQTAVATDPKQRQSNNVGEAIISGIPGLSQSLDAKVDAYGREIENKQTLPLGQMWDALKLSNSRETNDVIDEVSRLHAVDPNNKELQITPPMEDNTLSVKGTNVKITDGQKTQLQKDVGEAAVMAMRQVMQQSGYGSLSDAEKAAALDKARSNAQTQARKQFIEANGITPENNPGNTNSGGVISGDYASKAIGSAKSSGTNKRGISVNDSLSQEHKDILDKYNSMSSEDWDKYIYGDSAESAAAEYNLAKAKYENDLANGDITDVQKIKRQKELAKLVVSQKWTKDYRDAYSLAGSKTDMQTFLNELDNETRAKTVATLNGLNTAMYEAGVITESTYKTRANAINNTTSKKSSGTKSTSKHSGITSAEASALSSLAKTITKGSEGYKVKTTSAPDTKRKMSRARSGSGQTKLTDYSTKLATNVTVNKGAKWSIE